jgi:hypothetical protein
VLLAPVFRILSLYQPILTGTIFVTHWSPNFVTHWSPDIWLTGHSIISKNINWKLWLTGHTHWFELFLWLTGRPICDSLVTRHMVHWSFHFFRIHTLKVVAHRPLTLIWTIFCVIPAAKVYLYYIFVTHRSPCLWLTGHAICDSQVTHALITLTYSIYTDPNPYLSLTYII